MRELTFDELLSLPKNTPVTYRGEIALQPVQGEFSGSTVEDSSGQVIAHIAVPPLLGRPQKGSLNIRVGQGNPTGVFV